tara:strand:+ start:382 stop:552 length:171 start_codon:yes stop_codon:yes gene_type:complete
MEKMSYLTILDFEEGKVFQYKVSDKKSLYEEFATKIGHNLTNCQWMVHKDSKMYKK